MPSTEGEFPFAAIVGQEDMKSALLLLAVDPKIGGVLIRGQKGTGKSTLARSFAALLPDIRVVEGCPYNCDPAAPDPMHAECYHAFERQEDLPSIHRPVPFVQIPLNATEDRVAGSLQLEGTLRTGTRVFEPGLLAAANRGILYVDEVNLLEDHLVDLLLDTAASGVHRIEREGISVVHPSRFMLIGTMNPEEGELRPQFLDRFGISVSVKALSSLEERRDVVRRRIAFEEDQERFLSAWQEDGEMLRRSIGKARDALQTVTVPSAIEELIVRIAQAAGSQGHRAELTMLRASRALAALTDTAEVTLAEATAAARLTLPHRIPQDMYASPESAGTAIEEAIRTALVKTDAYRTLAQGLPEEKNEQNPADDTGRHNRESERIDPTQFQSESIPSPRPQDQEMNAETETETETDGEEIMVPGAAASGSIVFDFFEKKKKRRQNSR